MESVEKVLKTLDGKGRSPNVVLMNGGTGEEKSNLATCLALGYYKKSKAVSSASNWCRFSSKVVFNSCGEMADSLSLIQKLFMDLGHSLDASRLSAVQLDGKDRWPNLELLKRMLMTRLDNGKSDLIILDDVRDQQVISDLMVPLKDVNYLITSQRKNSWPDPGEFVHVGILTADELPQILANHCVGWKCKPFPLEVRGEVDFLIRKVQNHPLVKANLTTLFKCEKVLDLRTWIQLRKQLKNAIQAAHQSFAVVSLRMAIDRIIDKARPLLQLMLAIRTRHGVHENVLRLWFGGLHGVDAFIFNVALDYLQTRALMLVSETEVEWSNDPLNGCSIHDLIWKLLPEMYKEAVENILEKLIEREKCMRGIEGPDLRQESAENLVAILFLVCGDEKYGQNAQNRFKIHDDFPRCDTSRSLFHSQGERLLNFVKTIGQLLYSRLEEACKWEKTTDGLAKPFTSCRRFQLGDVAGALEDLTRALGFVD